MDKSFRERYRKMREYCVQKKIYLWVHGTVPDPEILQRIIDKGFYCKDVDLRTTALPFKLGFNGAELTDEDIDEELGSLQNWGYQDKKGFVLLGIPIEADYGYNKLICKGDLDKAKELTVPIWEIDAKGNNNSTNVLLRKEFVLGTIDMNNQTLTRNKEFSREHDYSGLDYDTTLVPFAVQQLWTSQKNPATTVSEKIDEWI